jgi:hypothetical protein
MIPNKSKELTPVGATILTKYFDCAQRWCKENERSFSWFIRKAIAEKLESLGYHDPE